MFSDVRKRAKKAGQPPGTAVYTGKEQMEPAITVLTYDKDNYTEKTGKQLSECLSDAPSSGITWVNVDGLRDVTIVNELAERFNLHPLTVEDILNVEQRPKVEEFDGYVFVTLKTLDWRESSANFVVKQISIILGENFVLTFKERSSPVFDTIRTRLQGTVAQRIRQHGSDYLTYRLIDAVIDQYFIVLDELGDMIESVEDRVSTNPTQKTARRIYRLKRQMLILRKAIWPVREALGHLLHGEDEFITKFTRVYLRDAYDHTVQAIDTVEIFRDMLSGILDMYLTGLSNRMNEIMKTLTIITTIFIPITAIASIYGMNFVYIPELKWEFGYPLALSTMALIAIGMSLYFKKKKWF